MSKKSAHRAALIEDHNRSFEDVSDSQMVLIKDEVVEILHGEYDEFVQGMNKQHPNYVSMKQWAKARAAIEKRVTRSLNLRSKYRSDGSLRS